ncbi:MAG: hypothetical protein JXB17_11960 [Bacteroidales bacterium]|nr:hypothetical protein [Bacteroidales bacterium]
MIFLTVGTTNMGFKRLVQKIDEIQPSLNTQVIAQIGNTNYIPKNIEFEKWLSSAQMKHYYSTADIIISHAGFGTISEVLEYNKPLIVIPRKFESNEAVNNQEDLANKLSELGYVKSLSDLSKLEESINNIEQMHFKKYKRTTTIPDILSTYLSAIKK